MSGRIVKVYKECPECILKVIDESGEEHFFTEGAIEELIEIVQEYYDLIPRDEVCEYCSECILE